MVSPRVRVFSFIAVALLVSGCSSSDDPTSPSSPPPASSDQPSDPPATPAPTTPPTTPKAPKGEYAALIRATLAGSDLPSAKAAHDAIARGGEAASKTAGDYAHRVSLGTKMLDSKENEFLAIDRWTDATAMEGFYANPELAKAFGSLFAAPPTIEFFELAPTWVNWGDMRSGESSKTTSYTHLALGTLANADVEKNHASHDAVAAGGKEPSIGAGNIAHVVYLGLHDKRRFVGVDIWGSGDNIEAFYSNPQFVAAFGPLFESVSQPVYSSVDWYQW